MTGSYLRPGSVEEVQASPRGKKVGAFFDLDGTLIAGYSAKFLAQDRMKSREFTATELLRTFSVLLTGGVNQDSFAALLEIGAEGWRGKSNDELDEMGQRLFDKNVRELIYPEMKQLVAAHQARGHTVVLSSSASSYQVEPVARFLGIDHVLCNRMILDDDGTLTGAVERPVIFGPGKADAVKAFSAEHKVDLAKSYFYADGDEDVSLMYLVGNPRPTNPGKKMAKEAERLGWPVRSYTSRGSNPERIARAVVGLAAGAPIITLGVALGVVKRDKRSAINFIFQQWPEVMLATGNVHINVVGEENVWAQRPAVFLVNHRTTFDGVVAMNVLRKDFTAVAKADIVKVPVVGTVGRMLDVAWVDRENTENAIAAMKPLEELVAKGLSVLIAPEGTRTEADEIGPFKKGAFRIAMAAGIPVVPIVIRNADVIGGRGALALHPGTVDVAVLPPISVADWVPEELGERAEEVRQMYIDTLKNWPS